MDASRRLSRGFTLIEAMVVVMLVATVMSLAAPGMRAFASGQRLKALSYDLTSDLLYARSEALKRNAQVAVTPRSGGWAAGWAVTAGGAEILVRESANESLIFDNAPSTIVFSVWGRVQAPTTPVRMTVRSDQGAPAGSRCVELDLSGRAKAAVGACT